MAEVLEVPATLKDIRRLARSCQRKAPMLRGDALEHAAQAYGYASFQAARDLLSQDNRTTSCKHPLYFSAYWRSSSQSGGRETVLVHTRECWPELIGAAELFMHGLRGFRIDSSDHFDNRRLFADQTAARQSVCTAAAMIMFMEATGLRPLTRTRSCMWIDRVQGLPGKGEATVWTENGQSMALVLDAPRFPRGNLRLERVKWARSQGLLITDVRWAQPTAHSDGISLIAHERFADGLSFVVNALGSAPKPPCPLLWSGVSAPRSPSFTSPRRAAAGLSRRLRMQEVEISPVRNGAIAYDHAAAGMRWRPRTAMPLEAHTRAAALLLRAQDLRMPAAAWHRIESIRADLHAWFQQEYAAPCMTQHSAYQDTDKAEGSDCLHILAELSDILLAGYPSCPPLNSLLRKLRFIQASVARLDCLNSTAAR